MSRWSAEDLARVNARIQAQLAEPLNAGLRKAPKYRNKQCTYQGIRFHSQHEKQWYKNFELQRLAGDIRSVIRQVSLPLPSSGRRIRVDFLLIENDGKHRWIDAKGFATPEWKLKAQIVKDAYGIEIETV